MRLRRPPLPTVVRVLAGGVFLVFGIGKFANHASELASFRAYGLPWPAVSVVVIGVLEVVGGLLLLAGRLVRPTALAMAGNMTGAILVSGLGRWEVYPSLTLAPLLLVGMLYLLVLGGRPALAGASRRTRDT